MYEYQMFMLGALVRNVKLFKKQQEVAAVAANRISGCAGSSRLAQLIHLQYEATFTNDCLIKSLARRPVPFVCVCVCVCVQLGTATMACVPSVNKSY
jgi:hypothetical protein